MAKNESQKPETTDIEKKEQTPEKLLVLSEDSSDFACYLDTKKFNLSRLPGCACTMSHCRSPAPPDSSVLHGFSESLVIVAVRPLRKRLLPSRYDDTDSFVVSFLSRTS